VRDCLAFVDARAATVDVLEKAKASGALPLRTVHGDPKLDNVLFDSASGRAVGLVDLDTVQPGLLHYDLGDCLRSACNPAGESPPDPAAARFDLELARAILASYLAETRGFLTAAELDYLPEAIRLIPLELGMRFLADHFDGDRYFKVEYRGHNLLRARTQFALTASVEARLDAIRATIAALGR
jgi:Ser/Thr protein kinase RdoA (MazF antagonist)